MDVISNSGTELASANSFNLGEMLKPLPQDILNKGFKLIEQRNFDSVDKLAADGKLGATGYFFGSAIKGIFKSAELSAEANMARLKVMESFMTTVAASNAKIQDNYHIIRKMREESKRELIATVKSVYDNYCKMTTQITQLLSEGKMSGDIYLRTLDSYDKMLEQSKGFEARMTVSLGMVGDEDKIMLAIQETNKTMVDKLTYAMLEMSKNDSTAVQTAMQTVKEVVLARINQKNGNQSEHVAGNANNPPAKDDTEKLSKPVKSAPRALSSPKKEYKKYKARGDLEGDTKQKEFTLKKGDIFYVYKEKTLNGHLWYKAHKAKVENPEEANTSEKGYISSDHVKPM